MKLNDIKAELTPEELEAVEDAMQNTGNELMDDGEDEAAAVLKAAYKKIFNKHMDD